MSVRISEQFFWQLLDDPQASSAVFALDRRWCAREGVDFRKLRFGLAEPEFTVHLCVVYLSEVFNGGHEQFFGNAVGKYWRETKKALKCAGLPQIGQVFGEACLVFPGSDIPLDQDKREQLIEKMSASQLQAWNSMDQLLYALEAKESVWNTLRDYLRRNEKMIMAPERGLVIA